MLGKRIGLQFTSDPFFFENIGLQHFLYTKLVVHVRRIKLFEKLVSVEQIKHTSEVKILEWCRIHAGMDLHTRKARSSFVCCLQPSNI